MSVSEERAAGRAEEQERIKQLVNNKICFEHRDAGNCDHQLCWGLVDLLRKIDGVMR